MTFEAFDAKPAPEQKEKVCHDRPAFGCQSCIDRDRTNWCKTTFERWKKTYKPPKCKGCRGSTFVYDWSFEDNVLSALVGCATYVEDVRGEWRCSDYDFEVKIA